MRFSEQILSGSVIHQEIIRSIGDGLTLGVNGIVEALSCLILDDLGHRTDRPILIITPTEKQARRIAEQMEGLNGRKVLFFPKKELLLSHVFTESREYLWQRVAVLGAVSEKEAPVVVTASVEALLYRLMDPSAWQSKCLSLEVGGEHPYEMVKSDLVDMGYERVPTCETPGQFSVRGGILDIFPPDGELPLRLEFFGDEVDSIRHFDPETQLSTDKMSSCAVRPAVEATVPEAQIRTLADRFPDSSFLTEVRDGLHREHLDQLLPYIEDRRFTLMDYLENPIVATWGKKALQDKAAHIHEDFTERFKELLDKGEALPGQAEMILGDDRFARQLEKHQRIDFNTFSHSEEDRSVDETLGLRLSPVNEYFGKLDTFFKDLEQYRHRGYRISVVVSDSEKRAQIEKVARERGYVFNHVLAYESALMSTQSALMEGTLESGFLILPTKTLVITDREIFGQKKQRRTKRHAKNVQAIKSFRELREGDYVVHEAHGVGRYLGIEQVTVENVRKDYMKIQYQQDEYLYIPIEQMQMIQKYVGGDVERVKINRLGTQEWNKTKSRAKKAIDDMTDELIALYSERMSRTGYAFSADTQWQREFEDLFPFEETPDQLKSIAEIKADMEKQVPMDRLLCGDVGYGKTEVALRAAFKAVTDSKQVAILVPTTILAQQHYTTLKERFSKYPIKVEMLSRFRNKTQQERILENLRRGLVDIIVGTHRLLSEDVRFKDIGLLVVDEEQRFGVRHKERIKALRNEVDVLTLTATPIPRTLHMSMMGVRDLSIIEDPPEDRYPIQTYVVEFRESVIREAIERELDRGGQVFFVYNIVKDIERMAHLVQRLVPDARVEYAHGQMSEKRLSDVMTRFLDHDFDVLVSTTIIETGLDISNVNTMIITNADRMGLSQLYQLRGRVGRSNRVAYAYLTYQRDKTLSEVAQKRLLAIKEFTELGSGFKIALRDLEIRGAGNLLGAQQHGHMEAIGYELYTKLLTEKMEEIKGVVRPESLETAIELQIDSYIPESYIPDIATKLEIYKKIATIESKEDRYAVEEEMEDRFGTLPRSVYNLLAVAYVKALSSRVPFDSVSETPMGFRLGISMTHPMDPELIVKVSRAYPNEIKVHAGNRPHLLLYHPDRQAPMDRKLGRLERFLEEILSLNNPENEI